MKRLWIGGILLLLLVVGTSGYRWWHSAATTTASIQPKPVSSAVLGSEIDLKTWQTGLFSTQQPSTWRLLQSNESPAGPIYGTYLLVGSGDNQSSQLGVTVGRLGNNTLAETGAVRLRQTQTSLYTAHTFDYAPPGAVGFIEQSGYEASIFWQHDGKYVSAVVSGGPQHKAELDQTLQAVVTHWTWQ